MTNKFEEWLEKEIDKMAADSSLTRVAELILSKYRSFLKEQFKCALQKSNHVLGCELEAVAGVLEFRRLTDEAETLRVVAARLK